MAKHELPKVSSTICKFCLVEVPVGPGTEHWMKPSDQFLLSHVGSDGFPCVPGSGTPLHSNQDYYVGETGYETVYSRERVLRLGSV